MYKIHQDERDIKRNREEGRAGLRKKIKTEGLEMRSPVRYVEYNSDVEAFSSKTCKWGESSDQ